MELIRPRIRLMANTLTALRRHTNQYLARLTESVIDPGAAGRRAEAEAKRERKAARTRREMRHRHGAEHGLVGPGR